MIDLDVHQAIIYRIWNCAEILAQELGLNLNDKMVHTESAPIGFEDAK
jgi:hypothetical protein